MSFLFPLYLLGALAIAIPILLHLRKRPPKEHVEFSSLMFLEKSPERLTRRTKIERWLLLALRCLALILLALMFGRPFLRSAALQPEAGEGRRIFVLIDRSASMQREALWNSSVAKAEATLSDTKATDEVAVAVFDESVRMIRDFGDLASLPGSARVGAFQSALSDAGVKGASWRSTRIGDALTEAAERLASASINQPPAEQEIVIISDFQEGADRDSLNRFAWPEDISVRPVAIAPDSDEGNLALHLVAAGLDEGDAPADSEESADRNRRRVRISNGRDSTTEHFTLTWQGNPDSKVEGFLPAGASRVMPVPPRPNEELDGVLEVSGDGVVFDNRVYVARAQPRAVDVVYLGSEAKADDVGSPLFYLSRAMHRTSTIDPTVSAIDFDSALSQIDRLKTAQVVVIRTDVSTPPALAEFLAGYTASGGMVITIVNEGTSVDTLQKLTGISGLSLTEAKVTDYSLLSGLDFEHPLLSPFAQAQIRDFTKIHTWRHRTLTLPEAASKEARVIAQFDGQSPAWLELPHPDKGGGRVFLFLSGWEPRESQLALSSKFVPLLYAMLGQAGFSAVKEPTRYVGQPIPLPGNETEVSITLPDGSTQVAEADSGNEFSATEAPGFYTVTSRDALGRPQARVHAINLAPSESRTEPADPAVALGDFGIPLTKSATDTTAALANATQEHRLEAEEKEAGQKLWKWFVVAALGILLIETLLAGRRIGTRESQTDASAA